MIDVGSEWRTFSNEKSATDRSRVGQAEVNATLLYHKIVIIISLVLLYFWAVGSKVTALFQILQIVVVHHQTTDLINPPPYYIIMMIIVSSLLFLW